MKKIFLLTLLLYSVAPVIQAVKIVSGPYLQMVTETEATIVWITDKKALSWVEIAPDDQLNFYAEERPRYYETNLGRAVLGTIHKVRIRKLTKGTTYRYRIFSREVIDEQPYYIAYGQTVASDVYSKRPLRFCTLDRDKAKINFLVVNDIHSNISLFNNLLRDFNKGDTDFVLFNGDMVNYMDSEQQLFDGFINASVKLFASETPFYMVRGNHESRGKFAQYFMTYFPTPTNLPYYSFKEGPVFFIVLDGGEDKPDNDIEYSGTSFSDNYRIEEAEWLRDVVQREDFKSSPFKVVITHIPPVQDTWHGPLHAKKLFLPILNEAGIDLMLCGHLHRHVYNEANVDGAKFPVLINSNTNVLKVEADAEKLNVVIKDENGTEIKNLSYLSHY